MAARNTAALERLDAAIVDAEENLGESEARRERACSAPLPVAFPFPSLAFPFPSLRCAPRPRRSRLPPLCHDPLLSLGRQVREALLARADYLTEIGDFPAAEAAIAKTEAKTVGLSHKLDLAFR